MPRDLIAEESSRGFILTESPEQQGGVNSDPGEQEEYTSTWQAQPPTSEINVAHPYVRPLTLADVESCLALENATFPEHERCSREKLIYRLTQCPELSLGLFSTATPDSAMAEEATASTARLVETAAPDRKEVLVAQVLATKCLSPVVTEGSMDLPQGSNQSAPESSQVGHQEEGRTIAIHSVAVLPTRQRRGFGTTVLKSYVQRLAPLGIADRIALLSHDHLISFYENAGFRRRGKSAVTFGGGGWNDLILELDRINA